VPKTTLCARAPEAVRDAEGSGRLAVKTVMRRSTKIWGALMLALGLAVPRAALAQGSIPPGVQPPVARSGSTVEGQEEEGRIIAVNSRTRTIQMDNGDEYVVPETVTTVNWATLRAGAIVRIRYNVNEGRNRISALKVLFR
jgi:hypothetical protein